MQTILYYLNWAFYDFNHLVWNSFVKPTLKFWALGAVFIATCLGPALIPNVTLEIATFWAVLVIIVSPFIWISYKIYDERKNPVIPETEVVVDVTYGIALEIDPKSPLEPLTIKQSIKQGVWWTGYLYFIVITAAILTTFFGDNFSIIFDFLRS